MAQWVIPDKPHTPLDEARRALDQIESRLAALKGSGQEAIDLLRLFDRAAEVLDRAEVAGADVRAERGRLESAWQIVQRRASTFLQEVGPALKAERESRTGEALRPWWYLDRIHAHQQRRRLLRACLVGLGALVALGAGWVAYERFLAPPPEVRLALRHIDEGERLADAGHWDAALEAFEAAAALTPDDPTVWIWIGVLRTELGDTAGAGQAFARAERGTLPRREAIFERGSIFLRLGDLEAAQRDAQSLVQLWPEWGYGYYLRASVGAALGDMESALVDYQRAAELAQAADDPQLEALARAQIAFLLQQVGQQE